MPGKKGDIFFSVLQCFSNISLQPISRVITKLVNSYIEEYPETDPLDAWNVEYVRFKWWKPGNYYSLWHSEHTKITPYRVLSFLIFLNRIIQLNIINTDPT